MATKMPTVGIDFGTSYSCIGTLQDGNVVIIKNERGNYKMPSYVAFRKNELLTGETAREQAAINPHNTVFDVKRIMGRKYNDPKILKYLNHWPFKIVNDCSKPKIQVDYKGETKDTSPELISSILLGKMKQTAENFIGSKVEEAVITVPAYFNHSQRKAILDAANIAGLNVLKILDESIATAITYTIDKGLRGERNLLVFDLGSGSFDVSIITVKDGRSIEVKSSTGDTYLSGKDIDDMLMKHLCEEFNSKYKKDINKSATALNRVRLAAEYTKEVLSINTEATIDIDDLFEGISFHTKLTVDSFERMCADFFIATVRLVEKALEDADLDKDAIDDIVLIGGCAQIPRIQSTLRNFFDKKSITTFVTHSKLAVYGAALQASILSRHRAQGECIVEVVPLSLGIETTGGVMEKIIERNTKTPCMQTKTFTTHYDYQTGITVEVFEGERLMTKHNDLLGTFVLNGIPSTTRRVPMIEVTFSLESNGMLQVSAKETSTGISKEIGIANCFDRHTKDEIERMVKEAETYEEEDTALTKRMDAINRLENYIFSVKRAINEARDTVKEKCDVAMSWVSQNIDASAEEYEHKLLDLQIDCAVSVSEAIHASRCCSIDNFQTFGGDTNQTIE